MATILTWWWVPAVLRGWCLWRRLWAGELGGWVDIDTEWCWSRCVYWALPPWSSPASRAPCHSHVAWTESQQGSWESASAASRSPRASTTHAQSVNNIYDKCTKHQFIHLLTATFKDLHIENSKNYKRWYCSHHTDCVSMCCWILSPFVIFAVFDVQVLKCCR